MQLYILDRDPVVSAQMIPDKYKFKMLIELGQLICSACLSNVYKPIAQGKELQQWVKENNSWVYRYFAELFTWANFKINMTNLTRQKLIQMMNDLYVMCEARKPEPIYAYFRYAQAYQCAIPSKTLLPIDECIECYKEYLIWKMKG